MFMMRVFFLPLPRRFSHGRLDGAVSGSVTAASVSLGSVSVPWYRRDVLVVRMLVIMMVMVMMVIITMFGTIMMFRVGMVMLGVVDVTVSAYGLFGVQALVRDLPGLHALGGLRRSRLVLDDLALDALAAAAPARIACAGGGLGWSGSRSPLRLAMARSSASIRA